MHPSNDIIANVIAFPIPAIPVSQNLSLPAVNALSLQDAAAEIVALAAKSDDRMLSTALKAVALKRRIVEGEAGEGIKWREWMKREMKMSQSHLYALVQIGSAKDPKQALAKWRRSNNQRSKNRPKDEVHLSKNHKSLLKLVRNLSDDEATNALVMLQKYHYRM